MTPPRPLGRVLSAAEANLYADAAGALARASAEAARITATARAASAQERDRIRAEAEAEGRANASRLLAETEAACRATLRRLQAEIAAAIGDGVARIIGPADPRAVAAAAAVALAELHERHGVVLRVAPAAVSTVAAKLGPRDGIMIVPDAVLPADACRIETQAGVVQADLGWQLATLRVALVEAAA